MIRGSKSYSATLFRVWRIKSDSPSTTDPNIPLDQTSALLASTSTALSYFPARLHGSVAGSVLTSFRGSRFFPSQFSKVQGSLNGLLVSRFLDYDLPLINHLRRDVLLSHLVLLVTSSFCSSLSRRHNHDAGHQASWLLSLYLLLCILLGRTTSGVGHSASLDGVCFSSLGLILWLPRRCLLRW